MSASDARSREGSEETLSRQVGHTRLATEQHQGDTHIGQVFEYGPANRRQIKRNTFDFQFTDALCRNRHSGAITKDPIKFMQICQVFFVGFRD